MFVVAPFDEATAPGAAVRRRAHGLVGGARARAARGASSPISTADEYAVFVSDGGAHGAQAARPRAAAAAGRWLGHERVDGAGRALRRRVDRGPRGHGGRRRPPPVAAGARRGHGRHPGGRCATTGQRDRGLRLLAGGGRQPHGDHPRAGRRAPAVAVGCADRGADAGRDGPRQATWSPWTGGPTRRPCSSRSSRPDGTTSTGTSLRRAPARRWTRSPARSPPPPSVPTARSGTAAIAASTRRACCASAATTPILARDAPDGDAGGRLDGASGGSRTPTAIASTASRSTRGRGTVPGDAPRPRRPALGGHGPLGAGRPGPRRCRLPGGDGQLPRLGGLRPGVARRADRQLRRLRARGRAGGAGRPGRARPRGPGAGGAGGLVVGRLRDADGSAAASRSGSRRWSRACRSPTSSPRSRTRRRSSRRSTGRCSEVRPTSGRTCTASATRSRTRMPSGRPLLILAGTNDSRCPIRQVWNYVGRLRERGFEPEVYTYDDRALLVRHRGAGAPDGDHARLPRGTVPGHDALDGLDAHVACPARPRPRPASLRRNGTSRRRPRRTPPAEGDLARGDVRDAPEDGHGRLGAVVVATDRGTRRVVGERRPQMLGRDRA